MKKLQVFISSTYIDLKEERQAAVESILDAGHIPAGMELFKAGNESQLKTINRWIDESDVYMLILGGRYGSIDSLSGKSYTHLEYEYALSKGIPVFAVVLTESSVLKKASDMGVEKVMEQNEVTKYKEFKELVLSKMVKHVEDVKDIKLSVHTALNEVLRLNEINGWVKGSEVENSKQLLKENSKLLKENSKLQKEIDKLKTEIEKLSDDKIGKYNYSDLKKVFSKKNITIPARILDNNKDLMISYMKFIYIYRNNLITGFTNQIGISKVDSYIYYNVLPLLVSFGLLEKVKVTGAKYEKIHATNEGKAFLAKLELEENLEND